MCINLEEDGSMHEWDSFVKGKWQSTIDVENFILNNYKEYTGTSEFLRDCTRKTSRLWNKCQKLLDKESVTNVIDAETVFFSGIDNFDVGYIDKKNEVIVGLQTDEPLKMQTASTRSGPSPWLQLMDHGFGKPGIVGLVE